MRQMEEKFESREVVGGMKRWFRWNLSQQKLCAIQAKQKVTFESVLSSIHASYFYINKFLALERKKLAMIE